MKNLKRVPKNQLVTLRLLLLALTSSCALASVLSSAAAKPDDAAGPFPIERTNIPGLKNATVGRFLYLGDVPRFSNPDDLLLVVSKMSLTVRAQGMMSTVMLDGYLGQLLERFARVYAAFQDPSMSFEALKSLPDLEAMAKNSSDQAWLKIVAPHLTHALDAYGAQAGHAKEMSREEYRDTILDAVARYYLQDPNATSVAAMSLYQSWQQNPAALRERSRALFDAHLGKNFTRDYSRPGYEGFLTFVYPIAATTAGPFSQPSEGIRGLGRPAGTVEARWWSDKWKDEFGGFPFLLLTDNGIAFHGPITLNSHFDVAYLRRGFVSHGCHRMDPSDLLELRTLLPDDFQTVPGLRQRRGVKTVTLAWYDVTDWNLDGKSEVMDVNYYDIPSSGSVFVTKNQTTDGVASAYLGENARRRFRNSQFVPRNSMLGAGNGYNPTTQLFTAVPAYDYSGANLVKKGVIAGAIPAFVFEHRPSQIIQYREKGVSLSGYDDVKGKYPPKFFK